jgi:GTPase SAR1 family protein
MKVIIVQLIKNEDASGIVIVYEISNRGSFEDANNWVDYAAKYKSILNSYKISSAPSNACKILVGNKCDLEKERIVSFEEG